MNTKGLTFMMAAIAACVMVMTACSANDNATGRTDLIPDGSDELLSKKVTGGWSEQERREVNDDGTLPEVYDWSLVDGGESNTMEITADSVCYFLANYTYKEGYLAFPSSINEGEGVIYVSGNPRIEVLSVTDAEMVTRESVLRDTKTVYYQILYRRMTDENLRWDWEHYGTNLRVL